MTVRRSTTSDGITVVTERVPGVRSVVFGAFVGVGSRDETDEEHGCAHFLEHTLFKGTARRTAAQLADPVDAAGGDLNAYTTHEHTCFHSRVLSDDLALVVDHVGDMLTAARNTPEDVDAERGVVLSEIDVHLDTPDDLVHSALVEQVVGEHSLGRETLGTATGIEQLPRDTVHGFYERWYRPGTVLVSAAGDIEHGAVVTLVEDHFGDLGRAGGTTPDRTAPAAPAVPTATLTVRDVEQSHVVIGGRTVAMGHTDQALLAIADAILGGGMSSRLFRTVREERGLAYTTYSWATAWTDTGMWGVYAGVAAEDHDEALELLVEQLDTFAQTLTDDEVERARSSLRAGMVLGLEGPGARMHRHGRWLVAGMEPPPLEELERRIASVTTDQVRDFVDRTYRGVRHLAVVGPHDTVTADAVA